ncbi:hypothetical protein MMC22_010106 [Lobaria immixta]|nr:hypothetical protein [Lobaria immixta]
MDQLPSIPGVTLTGIRTFIRGNRDSMLMASEVGGSDDSTRSKDDWLEAQHYIKVTHKISSESEAVANTAASATSRIYPVWTLLSWRMIDPARQPGIVITPHRNIKTPDEIIEKKTELKMAGGKCVDNVAAN